MDSIISDIVDSLEPKLLDCALAYADRGWRIFPVHYITPEGTCSCDKACNSPGKHPATVHGCKDATTDQAQIRAWWSSTPYNIGFATGNGIVAIDAEACYEEKPWRYFPQTSRSNTGGGGQHHLYSVPTSTRFKNKVKIADCVDIRSDGGYILLPPSNHVSGGRYEWDNDLDVQPMLKDLALAILEAQDQPKERPKAKACSRQTLNDPMRVIRCRAYLQKMRDAISGEGGHQRTYSAACMCYQFGLSDEEAFGMMVWFNEFKTDEKWTERELRHKLDDAKAAVGERFGEKLNEAAPTNPMLVSLDTITPKDVQWLWKNVLPAGKTTVFAGDPGLGKSFVTLYCAAQVSTGNSFHNDVTPQKPGQVIILSAEDDLADTVVPRLIAAGANLKNIKALRSVIRSDDTKEIRFLNLTTDLGMIEDAIQCTSGVRLVIIDPVSAYMGAKTDTYKTAEVRAVMALVEEIAQKYGVAILCIHHLNKGSGNAISRVGGSIGFVAAARMAWTFAKDQSDPKRRLMLPTKTNITDDNEIGMAYRIVSEGGVHLEWESGTVDMTADEALSDDSLTGQAVMMISEILTDGPMTQKELFHIMTGAGYKDGTCRAAQRRLKIQPRKDGIGKGSCWIWELPKAKDGAPILLLKRPPSLDNDHHLWDSSSKTTIFEDGYQKAKGDEDGGHIGGQEGKDQRADFDHDLNTSLDETPSPPDASDKEAVEVWLGEQVRRGLQPVPLDSTAPVNGHGALTTAQLHEKYGASINAWADREGLFDQ